MSSARGGGWTGRMGAGCASSAGGVAAGCGVGPLGVGPLGLDKLGNINRTIGHLEAALSTLSG